MMNLVTSILMVLSIMFLVNSNNPMKMTFAILLSSSIMFFLIKMKTGTVWMPLIFFILFMGGILMAFMILASILPNEKMMKLKMTKLSFFFFAGLILMSLEKSMSVETTAHQMKSFLSTGMTLVFMVSLILIYFFGSMSLNAKNESSMRALTCQYKMIL